MWVVIVPAYTCEATLLCLGNPALKHQPPPCMSTPSSPSAPSAPSWAPHIAGIYTCVNLCRLRSWFKPHNPGLTAAEALTSPFFTYHYDNDFTPSI